MTHYIVSVTSRLAKNI